MQTKFCDHAAYSVSGTFLADVTNNGTTLTVKSISSGNVCQGMRLNVPGQDAYRSLLATTQTGVGGYTLNYWASIFSNQTITGVGGMPVNPITWGLPLEGDGLARNPSTAAAVVTIDMSSAVAAAGNTFLVAGAVLTCVASGAGANQFNAGSNSTLVANLVAAINRAANTVTVAPAADGWYPHKVQDAVFARANPTNTKQLQIMTRAGSAVYNGNTNFQVTYTGITGLAGPYQFAGGVSGCWGIFINPVTAWPSSLNPYFYGVAGSILPLAGTRKAGDRIVCRSHSKLAGSTVVGFDPDRSGHLSTWEGTSTEAVVFDFDDGTVWPEDGADPVFRLTVTPNRYNNIKFGSIGMNLVHWKGKRYASGQRNCVLEFALGGTDNFVGNLVSGSASVFDNVDIVSLDSTTVVGVVVQQGTLSGLVRSIFRGCRVLWQKQGNRPMFDMSASSYSTSFIEGYDLTLELVKADDVQNGVLQLMGANTGQSVRTLIDGLNLVGFVQGSTLTPSTTTSNGVSNAILKNVNPGGVSNLGPSFKDWTISDQKTTFGDVGVFISSKIGKGLLSMDTAQGYIGWVPLQAPPCLNARLKDGTTAWSLRVAPSAKVGNITLLNPLMINCGTKRVNTAGKKKVTINFLMEKSMAWSAKDIAAILVYEDANGVARSQDNIIFNDNPALAPAPSSNWIRPSGTSAMDIDPDDGLSRPTYVDQTGTRYYNHFRIQITTNYPVAANGDIDCTLRISRNVDSSVQQIFIDPDLVIEDA